MKTGATKQQVEDALSRRDERWGYCHCRNCLNELQEWALDIVDENHRIVSVDDLERLRRAAMCRYVGDEEPIVELREFLGRIDALIAGDGE